jgi:hypothetical protein
MISSWKSVVWKILSRRVRGVDRCAGEHSTARIDRSRDGRGRVVITIAVEMVQSRFGHRLEISKTEGEREQTRGERRRELLKLKRRPDDNNNN